MDSIRKSWSERACAVRLLATVALATVSATGCDLLTAIGGGAGLHCRSDEACPRGMLCLDNACALPITCDVDTDCPAGNCRNGVCVAGGADAAGGDRAQTDHRSVDAALRDASHPEAMVIEAGPAATSPFRPA